MMCHTTGRPPIGSIGFGSVSLTSRMRVPWPPQRMTTLGIHPLRARRHEPLDRFAQPLIERSRRGEAELAARARDVEAAPRLPVRARRVPHDLAVVSGVAANGLGQVADRDLAAG